MGVPAAGNSSRKGSSDGELTLPDRQHLGMVFVIAMVMCFKHPQVS